jgi:PIN domain nuclease of toxin-antitoxin system
MDYLLDTHTFLWFINGDNALSSLARTCIEDVSKTKYVSIASFWDID